ncbi:NADH-quinone oxidoreductase subunit M [Saezia sanguinis]|uniref:NADH-quinone oxidoreductase subunit M n=1 Tax=Saezia sanguinis TaxID=1965230 RepID=A0A433SH54_9BURK|nr:NADH-quinone oxidoreductase subunit M [Saezia sanguinis]RUS68036.1 NADH-quinone oxidoreductase subunit M [Saezia sanguinis]
MLLSLAIWLPILFGVVLLIAGRDQQPQFARMLALIGAVISFLVTIPLITGFQLGTAEMQFQEFAPWITALNINYHLGIDGISVWFVLLTAFITVIVVIAGWEVITQRVHQYMGAFLILSGLMIGVFCAQDAVLFYVFFEATLIPMYIIIGVWGGPRRVYAAFKFFLYTLAGSLLMLVALIYMYNVSGESFALTKWYQTPLTMTAQTLLFIAFFAAFAVKIPMWPVHTWLPDAHVEAPTGGSVVLAAIMLKLGAYGFLRFVLPILPDASKEYAWVIIALSLIAVIYVGLVALVQKDMKKLVAYSSITHMGFVTLGIFLFTPLGLSGAIVQMISHGFVAGAMFLCIGVLYDRVHSREIADYGGVINTMPKFAALALLFCMANSGLPGTSGFIGEWMVILAAVKFNFWIGLLAATSLILAAAYTLWMYKRVYFGPVGNDKVKALKDIGCREFGILAVMAAMVIALGVFPKPVTDVMEPSIKALLDNHVNVPSKIPSAQ